MGAVFGLTAAVVCFVPAAVIVAAKGYDLQLAEAGLVRNTLGGVAGFALLAVIGVGFGALVRNQIVALAVVIGFSQLVEPIARIALGLIDPLKSVASYLPGAAGDALSGASFYAMSAGTTGTGLSQWAGGLVLAAYGVVAVVAGAVVLSRRDIT